MADDNKGKSPPREKRRRQPRKATAVYLERAALHYLDRYASSAANLRRILMNRVMRSARAHGTDPQSGEQAIKAIIAKLTEKGLLDDRTYARAKGRSYLRKGLSIRGIRAQLTGKGIESEIIDQVIADLGDSPDDLDLESAFGYARKRRLGPFRPTDRRDEWRARDLAALGRRGFTYDTAKKVIDFDAGGHRDEQDF
ncbi:MAG: regulatory protein RecX [Pseudomonadota bacterium]